MKKNEPPSVWASLALMAELGLVIALPMVIGVIVGNYLDGITHAGSLYLLLGLLLGLVVGVFGAYRLLAPFFKR